MSTPKPRRARAARPRSPATPSGSNYLVGYGKPPVEHRFKPGQSGNRKGRPRGAKSTATLLRELLERKIEVRTGDTVRKISVREAMLTRFAEAALKGDTKAAAFLLQLEEQAKREEQEEAKLVVGEDVKLRTEEEIKAALAARGLPESMLRRLEFHDPRLLELEAKRDE